nr:hypothetical protein [Oscillospiraceae bacterium]
MKRILLWILALVFLLGGCSRTEVTPESESFAAETETSSEAGDDLLPEVTGPDADGFFPAIPREVFDRWVTDGQPDTEKPAEAVTPFLETKSCLKYLAENFGGGADSLGDLGDLSDWHVLFEDDCYVFVLGMYDPYTYSSRDQWIPYRFVVLGNDAAGTYDRIAFVCRDMYCVYLDEDGSYLPRAETVICFYYGRESELQFGAEEDYAGAQSVLRMENYTNPCLVNPKTGRALLFNSMYSEMHGEIIPAREIPEGFGHTLYSVMELEAYKMNCGTGDRLLYLYQDSCDGDQIDMVYYEASTQELYPLALGNDMDPAEFVFLNRSRFALIGADCNELSVYSVEAETPWEPVIVLAGNGKGLSDAAVHLPASPLTDKNDPSLYVLPYVNLEDGLLHFCTFQDDGTIVENLSSGLRASNDGWYLDFQNFNDGIAYFL